MKKEAMPCLNFLHVELAGVIQGRASTDAYMPRLGECQCAVPARGGLSLLITFPAASSQAAGLVKTERFRRNCAQHEIDCVPLCLQAKPPHDRQTGFFIGVHARARYVAGIHIIAACAGDRSGDRMACVRRARMQCVFSDTNPKETMAWSSKPSKSGGQTGLGPGRRDEANSSQKLFHKELT